mmetsp:Transcript_58343/g.71343  ORF Transcript_58343/g.71343 Transcript_58343/m.71343 type:complete len:299 (-) Transcript_58343:295-1191(-)
MGHHCASRDDALGGSQVLAQTPRALTHVHELGPCCRAALDVKPEHATMQSIAMILIGQGFLWMRGQAWIHHLGHLGMFLQKGGDGHGIFTLFPHSQVHGLACLHDDVGSEGVDDVAMHILDPFHLLVQCLILADHCTSSHDVVPLVVLGQALNHHVCTPVQGTTDHGCGKGGINDMLGASILGDLGDRLDVRQGQYGVRWGLAEDQLGVWLHGLLHILGVPEVHKGELHAQGREELPAGPVGATIGAIRDDAVVSSLHGGGDGAGGGRHAGAEGAGAVPILQLGQLLFEHGHGGIVGS